MDMTYDALAEGYALESAENDRLRAILLAMAGRPEITQETRVWLAGQVKDKSQPVVHGLREDEMEEVQATLKAGKKLHDHIRKAVDRPEGEALTRMWWQQADAFCNQLAGRIQETEAMLGRDISDLEEAR